MAHSFQVTLDANHVPTLADFWQHALGYTIPAPPEGFGSWDDWAREMEIPEESWDDARALIDPDGTGPRIYVQKVPEPKIAKNRVHLDINVTERGTSGKERRSAIDTEVERLKSLGAVYVEDFDRADTQGVWTVMQDPEGNEFCVH